MINRLEAIQKKYNEITEELTKDETIKDIKKMTELSKEQRRLSETVDIYQKYKRILSDIEAAKEMLNDKEMQEFAKEEISNLNKEKEQIEGELEILLLPHDPNDEKNVYFFLVTRWMTKILCWKSVAVQEVMRLIFLRVIYLICIIIM